MQERLSKFLADCGVCSRRKAEEYILAGRVTVDSVVVKELGTKVDSTNNVMVDGKEIKKAEKLIYIMLHKPRGYVTTVSDQFGRASVMDLLEGITARVFPIGRLDFDTSGLILLTNDGDLTYKLTHPKHNVDKIYVARVMGTPTSKELSQFKKGIELDGKLTARAEISILSENEATSTAKVLIHEGRNRQVKRMFSAIGHEVVSLKRVGIGRLTLEDLPKGKFRYLTDDEVAYLLSL